MLACGTQRDGWIFIAAIKPSMTQSVKSVLMFMRCVHLVLSQKQSNTPKHEILLSQFYLKASSFLFVIQSLYFFFTDLTCTLQHSQ